MDFLISRLFVFALMALMFQVTRLFEGKKLRKEDLSPEEYARIGSLYELVQEALKEFKTPPTRRTRRKFWAFENFSTKRSANGCRTRSSGRLPQLLALRDDRHLFDRQAIHSKASTRWVKIGKLAWRAGPLQVDPPLPPVQDLPIFHFSARPLE